MRKFLKLFLLFFVFSALFLLSTSTAFAVVAKSERWVCLKLTHCWEGKPESKECAVKHPYRGRLSVKDTQRPLANSDTYIIECINTPDGKVCTTANSALDNKIYGQDNFSKLKADSVLQYTFEGIFKSDGVSPASNPARTDQSGFMGPFEWQSTTKPVLSRSFFGLNYPDDTPPDANIGAGQQQSSFGPSSEATKNCVAIKWDPYGRVFDSQTLEPIPNATVELLTKRDATNFTRVNSDEVVGGNFRNPLTTIEDGAFSFVVPDGIYKLNVSHPSYNYPGESKNLHPNYIKMYEDIYPYVTGEEIVQAGKIQHRDIPLDSKGSPATYNLKVIEYSYELDKSANKAVFTGRVSHPFANVRVYTKQISDDGVETKKAREIAKKQADRDGRFDILIDQSSLKPNELFDALEFEKVDLTQTTVSKILDFIFKKSHAQNAQNLSITLNPILNYVEGYIKDDSGKVIPNATVGVYLTFSNNPYFETKTDASGYVRISSEDLPWLPFELRFTTAFGRVVQSDSTKFVSQNTRLLKRSNISLNSYVPVVQASDGASEFDEGDGLDQNSPAAQRQSWPLILAVILGLFGIIGLIVAMGLLKKRSLKRSA